MRLVAGVVMLGCGQVEGWAQAVGAGELPTGQRVMLTVSGEGVQVYVCQVGAGAGEWVFQAPEARLLDGTGATMGTHGAGPLWQLKDGSSVTGEVVAKTPGASAGDIPSLLLKVKSHGGEGTLSRAEFVRRSETRGGVAPAGGCDAAHAGAVARVPYTARYTFYTSR